MRFASRFRRRRPWPEAETVVQEGPPAPVVEESEVAPPPPPPPPRGPLLWPWLLALLLLVVGGLVAWYVFTRDSDNGRNPPAAVTVPNVVGQKESAAVARVNRAGLTARVLSKPSKLARGTVFAEQPAPGSRVSNGSAVTLSVSAAATVLVPDVAGRRTPVAVSLLRGRGLSVQTTSVTSRQAPGTVLSQSPAGGARVAKGSTVAIRISRALVSVPDVTGQTRAAAESTLRGQGLVPRAFTVPSGAAKGTVLAQRPQAGRRVPRGSKVRLNVSNGQRSTTVTQPPPPPPPPSAPATVTVPDVTGQPQEVAQRLLNRTGLKAGVVYVPSTTDPEGTVVSESPQAGTRQKRGTRIQLNVSLGPNPGAQKAVPDVLGDDPQAASAKLTSAGFKVQRLSQNVSNRKQVGIVVDEQPAGGRSAPTGSTVTIYVGR